MSHSTVSTSSPPATSDTIAHALSLAIHEHKIAPGTKLGEDELAEIYGVSRTVVRAALQTLSHIKLVDIRRNRGASVASPTITEAHEVFEARELLEPRTARSAALHATAADIALLERHISDEHQALADADPGRALYLSGLFHTEIARIAQQATIAGFIETLIARSSLIIALYWRRESALCEKHAHHELVHALAAGQAQQAEELMRSHLVDLHSALDLRERNSRTLSLRDALAR
ncbi:GntR family transcriptional regulator [uncultured Tateyamaria sp.]|uniref:GntR family transcriptional regulator n=1 Tax=uncultured Tateyamaria sp. TaxID=455651 RepID=UPI002637423A|nr:GntR family transcriptional regulator [uncultured Tateyamaria sp.]